MYQGYRIGAVLLMGGLGSRYGGAVPKQFQLLGREPLYRHALETFLATGVFDEIVLVCHPKWMVEERRCKVVAGGSTRQESSRAGLLGFGIEPKIVAIHDAVRPFVTPEILLANLDAAIRFGAADTCIPTADTLVFAPESEWVRSIPKREEFLRGQTPQTFRFEWIAEAHEWARRHGKENVSDDCRLVLDLGREVAVVKGSEENIKITSEFDLKVAEALLSVSCGAPSWPRPVQEA